MRFVAAACGGAAARARLAATPGATYFQPAMTMRSIVVVARRSPEQAALLARLEAEGYLTIPAETLREAQEVLRAMVPGALFIDLAMPDRQGRRFAEEVEGDPQLRMIPRLVALGAWRRNTRPVSAAAVFVKPLDLEHVTRALAAIYPAPTAVAHRPVASVTALPARPPKATPAGRGAWDSEDIAAALAG
jgi:CheY-like chemotaxis protein